VHGHLHSLIYGQEDRTWDGGCRYFNVSVEKIGYTPISEIQIKEMLTKGITSI
jgi:calcineurin-like phosphoesterase family protein